MSSFGEKIFKIIKCCDGCHHHYDHHCKHDQYLKNVQTGKRREERDCPRSSKKMGGGGLIVILYKLDVVVDDDTDDGDSNAMMRPASD